MTLNLLRATAPILLSPILFSGCAAPGNAVVSPAPTAVLGAATAPSPGDADDSSAWTEISEALGRPGILKDEVYTVTFPRSDLDVDVEHTPVPTAAGLASEFRFYGCPCGTMNVIGQFCLADYEANDVIDALRQGHFVVASVGPMLLYEQPRLLLVRFQAEGQPAELAKVLREALTWTGKERTHPAN